MKIGVVVLLPDKGHLVPIKRLVETLYKQHEIVIFTNKLHEEDMNMFGTVETIETNDVQMNTIEGLTKYDLASIAKEIFINYHEKLFDGFKFEELCNRINTHNVDCILSEHNRNGLGIIHDIATRLNKPTLLHEVSGDMEFSSLCEYYNMEINMRNELYVLLQNVVIAVLLFRDVFRKVSFEEYNKLYNQYRNNEYPNNVKVIGSGVTSIRKVHDFYKSVYTPINIPITKTVHRNIEIEQFERVVFISFGTQCHPPHDTVSRMINVLRTLNITFVWSGLKTEIDLPTNIVPYDYVDQVSILNSPNVVACICHGGTNTLMECLDAGVCIIVIPQTSDQPFNANVLKHEELCQVVNNEDIEKNLSLAIRTMKRPKSVKVCEVNIEDQFINFKHHENTTVNHKHMTTYHVLSAITFVWYWMFMLLNTYSWLNSQTFGL